MTPEIKRFGQELREFINSDPIFAILPEGDWGEGGCWILAKALRKFLGPPAELWAIAEPGERGPRVQHVVVKDGDAFFDYTGAHTGSDLLDGYIELYSPAGSVGLMPMTKEMEREAKRSGIPCPATPVAELVTKLTARFGPHEYH